MIVLGVIHLIATMKVIPMFQNLNEKQLPVFLFMYLASGMGTVLPGIIVKQMANGLAKKDRRAWKIVAICSVYSLLMGIGAVIAMNTNPFAYLMLLIALSLFIPTVLIKKDLP